VTGIAITGAQGRLGQRILQSVVESPETDRHIVAVDRVPADQSSIPSSGARHDARVRSYVADVSVVDLLPLFGGCDVLVHLASEAGGNTANSVSDDQKLTQRVLDAAVAANIEHIVVVSSAVVYGAYPDNPVPITEAMVPNPNPGFAFAQSRLVLEQLAEIWRNGGAGRTLTILRPAVSPAGFGTSGWLAEAVFPSKVDQLFSILPPVQYVHVDDVASAILHSVDKRLDGTFNVAPDRWLRGEDAPALMGMLVSVPATGQIREIVSMIVRNVVRPLLALNPRPSGAAPWSRYPFVVANDRLKATGWQPLSTTEEVLVARKAPTRLAKLFARKRQEVTIAAVGAAGVTVGGAIFAVWRRWLRGR
jgi:nucleoside-diphosphate-sugar epimerase